MAATMKRDDVPAEMVDLAATELREKWSGLPHWELQWAARTVLAAAIPAVREQVAKEIEAAERALSETDPATAEASHRITAWCGGLLEGARLARGETTTTTPTTKENSK